MQEEIKEPIVPFNHSGYGIKLKDLVTYALILVGGVSFAMTGINKLDSLAEKVDVKNSELSRALNQLTTTVETARQERNADMKLIEGRVAKNEQELARVGARIENTDRLMADIRDYLRGINPGPTTKPKI